MAGELEGRKVAVLIAPAGTEQVEFERPRDAIVEAGGSVDVLGIETGEAKAYNGDLDPGDTFTVDKAVSDASVDDYDAVVVPGGTVGADKLRSDPDVVGFVRSAVERGLPTAVICHGPWVLAEADVVRGKQVTSWSSLRTDLRNAGANWVDQEVVVDGNLITSRKPADVEAFVKELIAATSSA